MEKTEFVNVVNFTDFVYYDTEFDTSPPAPAWCPGALPWWGACVGQACLLLFLLILYRLLRLCPSLNCPHPANILTLYINFSLWVWVIFLILGLATCSLGVGNPLIVTAIVFVSVFGVGSVIDCFFGTEGWYLVDLRQMADAIQHLEKIKTSPPIHRVHIECFHTETVTLFNTRGKLLTRARKIVTYTDHRDFPYSSWSDISDWPVLETIATQGNLIIGISLERCVEPGDPDTNSAFNNFRNRFVQQNCHRDEQVRTWITSEIPDLGSEQSIFISTKPKEEMPFIFKIGFFLTLSSLCLSCPLRTHIRKKTKLVPLKVRKVYFSDPDKLSPLPPSHHPQHPGLAPPSHHHHGHHTTATLNGPGHSTGYGSTGGLKHDYGKSGLGVGGLGVGGVATAGGLSNGPLPAVRSPAVNPMQKDPLSLDKTGVRGWEEGYRDYGGPDDKCYPMSDHPTRSVYLPGKDYYDETLYSQRKQHLGTSTAGQLGTAGSAGQTATTSLQGNFDDSYYEEEERLYGPAQPHPRVAMLKSNHLESDLRGGRSEYNSREGRRVHYQERDYRRHQSPSPGPRERGVHPVGHHRSRRGEGEDSWTSGGGFGYSSHLQEDEALYNA